MKRADVMHLYRRATRRHPTLASSADGFEDATIANKIHNGCLVDRSLAGYYIAACERRPALHQKNWPHREHSRDERRDHRPRKRGADSTHHGGFPTPRFHTYVNTYISRENHITAIAHHSIQTADIRRVMCLKVPGGSKGRWRVRSTRRRATANLNRPNARLYGQTLLRYRCSTEV